MAESQYSYRRRFGRNKPTAYYMTVEIEDQSIPHYDVKHSITENHVFLIPNHHAKGKTIKNFSFPENAIFLFLLLLMLSILFSGKLSGGETFWFLVGFIVIICFHIFINIDKSI